MIIKRPKTTNNFEIYHHLGSLRTNAFLGMDIWEEIEDFEDRDEERWGDAWKGYLENSLNFWTIIVLLESIHWKSWGAEQVTITLSDCWNPKDDSTLFEYEDKEIYEEIAWWDYQFPKGASFQYTLFRISEACGLFLAFDIATIRFSAHPEEIIADLFQQILEQARKSPKYGGEDDQELFIMQVQYLQSDQYTQRAIYGAKKWYEAIWEEIMLWSPKEDCSFILEILWEYLEIDLEVNIENVVQLQKYIYKTVENTVIGKDWCLGKLVDAIAGCETIWNLIRIPAKLLIDSQYPLIWAVWYLWKNEVIIVTRWDIAEYLEISIETAPMLKRVVQIEWHESVSQKKQFAFRFDAKNEILFCNETRIVTTRLNTRFLSAFIDQLLNENTKSIEFDAIAMQMDDSFESQSSDTQRKMIRSIYDRVKGVNESIARQCQYDNFLLIQEKRVLLRDPNTLIDS